MEEYSRCQNCNIEKSIDDIYIVIVKNKPDCLFVCKDCFNMVVVGCEKCRSYFHVDRGEDTFTYLREYENKMICYDCYNKMEDKDINSYKINKEYDNCILYPIDIHNLYIGSIAIDPILHSCSKMCSFYQGYDYCNLFRQQVKDILRRLPSCLSIVKKINENNNV